MKKPLLLLVILLGAFGAAFSQASFLSTFGTSDERAYSVKQTFEGDYIIAGSIDANSDILFMKADAEGQLLWAKKYGGTGVDRVACTAQTRDSGYVLVGSTSSFGAGSDDCYLIKTDANGNVQWSRAYGGAGDDDASYVAQTRDGGYVIAGGTDSYGQGQTDCYLIRTNASGQLLWAKTYGGGSTDGAYSARLTRDGGVVMVGSTESFLGDGTFDAYMLYVDSVGNLMWAKAVDYGGPGGGEEGFDVVETFDGGFVFSMEPEHTAGISSGGDFALMKLDRAGNLVWNSRSYGWDGWDFGYAIQQTPDSGFVVAGVRGLFNGQKTRAVVYKSDEHGTMQWFKSYGDSLNNRDVQSVDVTTDGGVVMAGYVRDTSLGYTGAKLYVIKIGGTGDSVYCTERNEILPRDSATLIFTPGGVAGTGGIQTIVTTITSVIALKDAVFVCAPLPCSATLGIITSLNDTVCKDQPPVLHFSGIVQNVQWQYSTDGTNYNDLVGLTGEDCLDIPTQTSYYRVQSTDGNCPLTTEPIRIVVDTTCQITRMEEIGEERVRIYPNPSSVAGCQLWVASSLVGANLEVLDANGRVVFLTTINQQQTTISPVLSSGVYFIRISSPRASVVKKFIRL